MKIMPFDDHRKQNDTIHNRMVRLRRSGVSRNRDGGRERPAFRRLRFDLGNGAFRFGDTPSAEQIAHRFRHHEPDEEKQHGRNDADNEYRAPAIGRDDEISE
jgi:hypothetical protein